MIDLDPKQIKLLKWTKSKMISEKQAQKCASDVNYLLENDLLEPVYRPLTESELSGYSNRGSNFIVMPPPGMIDGYQITAAGRAVLNERGTSDRRWRITTGIALAALILSAISIIWQISERLFGV